MLFCVLSLSGKEGSNVTDEAIAVRLENHEQEIKSLKHRMDEREEKDKTLSELTTSVRTLAVNMEYMAKEQQKQGERLNGWNTSLQTNTSTTSGLLSAALLQL